MKDKELDQLIQQMFGDADGAAPQSDAAQKEAAFLAELKTDLKALNEGIPECQMSVDRLRHAVLNSTQREASRAWRFSKVFGVLAGGAAAVMAVALITNTFKQTGNPVVEPREEFVAMSTGEAKDNQQLDLRLSKADPAPVKVQPKVEESVPTEPEPDRVRRTARKANRGDSFTVAKLETPAAPTVVLAPTEDEGTRAQTQPSAMKSRGGGGAAMDSGEFTQGIAPGAPLESAKLSADSANIDPDSTVVIVNQGTPRTGRAGKATEVKRDEDVVFGG